MLMPTDQFETLASMEVHHGEDQIALRLSAKHGTRFDASDIAACLDHTVNKIEGRTLVPPSTRASVIDTAAASGDGDLATCTAALTVGNARSRPSTASRPLVRAKAGTGPRTSAAGRV